MNSEDEVPLSATVEPWAALVLLREHPKVLQQLEAAGQRLMAGGHRGPGEQCIRAARQIRQVGRTRAALTGRAAGATGEGGSVEGSACVWLSVQEAAEVLEVSEPMVRRLARDTVIVGRRARGRRWELDRVSVLAHRDRRFRRDALGTPA